MKPIKRVIRLVRPMAGLLFGLLSSIWLTDCGPNQSPGSQTSIAGTYVREVSFEETHPETGKLIGRSIIRDTLFIQKREQGFEVRQTKWRLNDFDREGWRDQRHADDRPAPAYEATFDQTNRCLCPASPGGAVPLYVEVEKAMLYQGSNRRQPYHKVPLGVESNRQGTLTGQPGSVVSRSLGEGIFTLSG